MALIAAVMLGPPFRSAREYACLALTCQRVRLKMPATRNHLARKRLRFAMTIVEEP